MPPLRSLLLCCALAWPALAAPPSDAPLIAAELKDDAEIAKALREYYTKYEYRIPMRDGVKLYTVAYVPKDGSRTWPVMLDRTPYSVQPYGADNFPSKDSGRVLLRIAPSKAFIRDGFIFVHQDVRGRLMSEGTFVDVRPHATKKGECDESTDAWDTVDWLVKNVPGNNGRVGVWGISYPGFYAAQAAVDAHPAVKAVSPQAPVTEWFLGDDFHHNGAFFLSSAFGFFSSFGKARPKPVKKLQWGFDYDLADQYDFYLALGPLSNAKAKYLHDDVAFWDEAAAHPNRDGWWKARDPRPFYKNVKPAVLTVGGWFDAEDLWGTLETYRAFERQSPGADVSLVMGPWKHGGWARTDGDRLGDVSFGQKASLFYREQIELPFFAHHLKGRPAPEKVEAWIFETGTNVWRTYARWPPAEAKPATLYFGPQGTLSATAPAQGTADSYVSDPSHPVPYTAKYGQDTDADYMTGDQRFAARRPDVLAYATRELDADVTLAGPLEASLQVALTGTDADFVVKLIDVYPQDYVDPEPQPGGGKLAGAQVLVRAEVMRGHFRDGFETPKPFAPNQPAAVRFTLPDVSHTFRSGHRIMVQVQSSWFPLVDRNPQTFVESPFKATEADFQPELVKVFRSKERPSGLTVNVLRGALP